MFSFLKNSLTLVPWSVQLTTNFNMSVLCDLYKTLSDSLKYITIVQVLLLSILISKCHVLVKFVHYSMVPAGARVNQSVQM